MSDSWPDPKVVISDTPPPVLQLRTQAEYNACDELVRVLRRGYEPVVFVCRNANTNTVEVHARSNQFASIQSCIDIMQVATAKLVDALFRKKFKIRFEIG